LKNAQKKATAIAIAGNAGVQVVVDPTRVVIADAIPKSVQAAIDRKSAEAAEIYKRTLDDFLATCKKTYADELTRRRYKVPRGDLRPLLLRLDR
jgi:hypothetical protein